MIKLLKVLVLLALIIGYSVKAYEQIKEFNEGLEMQVEYVANYKGGQK